MFSHVVGASTIYPSYKKRESKAYTEEGVCDLTAWQAVREGKSVELDVLLSSSKDVHIDEVDNTGYTLLHQAAKTNNIATAKVIIKHGADVNIRSKPYGISPLHEAARQNSSDVAQLLIDKGAKVMIRDVKQKTPLHFACKRGADKVATILLECKKCDVNARDEDKITPLHVAVFNKQGKIVPLLLKYGANTMAVDINGIIPFMLCAMEDLAYTMKLLMDHGGPEKQQMMLEHTDIENNSALHLAVSNDKIQAVAMLLKQGANVNLMNDSHYTPLHIAAVNGNSEIASLLLDHGAIVDARDKDYMTPLHRAAMYNRQNIIQLLMSKGGNINTKNKDQMTPLLSACWKGHINTIKFLLSNGAMITETDNKLKTVIHWTVDHNHVDVINLLMEHGGKTLLENVDFLEETPLHYAARLGNSIILNTLIKSGSVLDARDHEGNTPLHIAAAYDCDSAIDILIQTSQAELNDGDCDGNTPLMKAAIHGNCAALKSLISHGADISCRDENSCTALMLASKTGNTKIVRVLLDNYAEVNLQDKVKNTALHMSSQYGHSECVDLLIRREASLTMKNSYGKTALDLALENKQSEVAVALVRNKNWQDIMDVRDDKQFTPMKKLVKMCPEAAMIVMDHCIERSHQREDDPEYSVKYDFKYIDAGPNDPMCKRKRYYAIKTMVKYRREGLLSHPLVQTLLNVKWKKFGRGMFYTDLVVYVLLLASITLYTAGMPVISTSLLDDVRNCPITLTDDQLANETLVEFYKKNGQIAAQPINDPTMIVVEYAVALIVFYFELKEICCLFSAGWRYFFNLSVYLTWSMLISTTVLLTPFGFYPCLDSWRAGWISALLIWVLLLLTLRGVDKVGIYFVMFLEVLWSIAKVLIVLILFLMAFSQAFSITMAQTDGFKSDSVYPLTILAMTLGELNYVDNFVSGTTYPFTTDNYILMTLFMLVMPIALMNLLIGIAVGDIDKIQNIAYLTRLAIQVKKLCASEQYFPRFLQRKLYQRYYKTTPNEDRYSRCNKVYRKLTGKSDDQSFITEEKEDVIAVSIRQIENELKKSKQQLTQMAAVQKQTNELIAQLCEQFNVNYKLDNVSVAESFRTDINSKM